MAASVTSAVAGGVAWPGLAPLPWDKQQLSFFSVGQAIGAFLQPGSGRPPGSQPPSLAAGTGGAAVPPGPGRGRARESGWQRGGLKATAAAGS